jgi:hypothetical protein
MSDVGHFYKGIDLKRNKSSNLGVNFSEKSMVTYIRVYIEGNGTIIILRMKD